MTLILRTKLRPLVLEALLIGGIRIYLLDYTPLVWVQTCGLPKYCAKVNK